MDQDAAICVNTFGHSETALTGQQRFWQFQIQVILFKPTFGAHFDHVAKPLGGDQRCLGSASFNQGVGCKGCAVDDLANIRWRNTCLCANLVHAVDDRVFRGRVGGQNLCRKLLALYFDHNVSKRAADVDAHADCAVAHVC